MWHSFRCFCVWLSYLTILWRSEIKKQPPTCKPKGQEPGALETKLTPSWLSLKLSSVYGVALLFASNDAVYLKYIFCWCFTVYLLFISSPLDSLTENRLRLLFGLSLKVGLRPRVFLWGEAAQETRWVKTFLHFFYEVIDLPFSLPGRSESCHLCPLAKLNVPESFSVMLKTERLPSTSGLQRKTWLFLFSVIVFITPQTNLRQSCILPVRPLLLKTS